MGSAPLKIRLTDAVQNDHRSGARLAGEYPAQTPTVLDTQAASDSLGEDNAAGGVFRAYGQWTLVGKDSENTGTLTYKVENRHRLETDIAPRGLGSEIGYAGLTAVTFSKAKSGKKADHTALGTPGTHCVHVCHCLV
jgi:hypothetical protein